MNSSNNVQSGECADKVIQLLEILLPLLKRPNEAASAIQEPRRGNISDSSPQHHQHGTYHHSSNENYLGQQERSTRRSTTPRSNKSVRRSTTPRRDISDSSPQRHQHGTYHHLSNKNYLGQQERSTRRSTTPRRDRSVRRSRTPKRDRSRTPRRERSIHRSRSPTRFFRSHQHHHHHTATSRIDHRSTHQPTSQQNTKDPRIMNQRVHNAVTLLPLKYQAAQPPNQNFKFQPSTSAAFTIPDFRVPPPLPSHRITRWSQENQPIINHNQVAAFTALNEMENKAAATADKTNAINILKADLELSDEDVENAPPLVPPNFPTKQTPPSPLPPIHPPPSPLPLIHPPPSPLPFIHPPPQLCSPLHSPYKNNKAAPTDKVKPRIISDIPCVRKITRPSKVGQLRKNNVTEKK